MPSHRLERRAGGGLQQFAPGRLPAPYPPEPNTLGVMALDVDLNELRDYIDWGPFFQTWDLAGSFPRILDDEVVGETARGVFADAREMLEDLIAQEWLQAKAAFGIFPANSVGDDIEFYDDESREAPIMTWFGLRQQHERPSGKPHWCLADFVAPKASGCATGAAPLR